MDGLRLAVGIALSTVYGCGAGGKANDNPMAESSSGAHEVPGALIHDGIYFGVSDTCRIAGRVAIDEGEELLGSTPEQLMAALGGEYVEPLSWTDSSKSESELNLRIEPSSVIRLQLEIRDGLEGRDEGSDCSERLFIETTVRMTTKDESIHLDSVAVGLHPSANGGWAMEDVPVELDGERAYLTLMVEGDEVSGILQKDMNTEQGGGVSHRRVGLAVFGE